MRDKQAILENIFRLHAFYKRGLIKTLAQHEVNPGLDLSSRENFLYFTLPPCLNFQRSSPAMWQAALKTWNDPETHFVYYPEKVAAAPRDKLQQALLKHKLALQKNKHCEIWEKICATFHGHFQDDPRQVLAAGAYDARQILILIQKEKKHLFPYLSGPKMANYWLYILSQYTNARFQSMDAISIIPDTHVMQCSTRLGIADDKASVQAVAEAWKTLLEGTGLTPVDMHPVLWNWSRNDFQPDPADGQNLMAG